MMTIDTKYLGDIEIEKEKIIHFETGIPGFEAEKQFVLLDIPENDLFQILQSVKTPELAFFVANPYHLFKNYTIKLEEHIIEQLEIKSEKDVVVLSILTIKEPFTSSTVNLKAPIVINITNKRAKQFIMNDDKYSMRTQIPPISTVESGV